jgi:hypothetical protein
MLRPESVVIDLMVTFVVGVCGIGGAWLLRRRTTLSAQNLYVPATIVVLLIVVAIAVRWWDAVLVLLPVGAPWVVGAVTGRRWRLADLGAGEELRNHELARRWIWQPAPERASGERKYLRSQGEHEFLAQANKERKVPWLRVLGTCSSTARSARRLQ